MTTLASPPFPSTILAADVILVLQDGRLVDHGAHHELLERGGLYRTLYEHQFNLDGPAAPPSPVGSGSEEAAALT